MDDIRIEVTEFGLGLLVKALSNDEPINFVSLQFGNGEAPDNFRTLTSLVNPLLECEISSIERGENYVMLSTVFDNNDVSDSFNMTEIGAFAEDKELGKGLFAYINQGSLSERVLAVTENKYLENNISVQIIVDSAINVTASIKSMTYATKKDFEDHVNDTQNPHKVTAKDVGLGNIENKTISEQTPVFDEVSKLSTIESGEKVGSVFAKVKMCIDSLMSHLSASNPHKITASLIGAAASTHYHSASQINSGTLSALRGGTGCTSLSALADKLKTYLNIPVFGTYTGDGTQGREIVLGFKPACVILANANGNFHDDINGYPGGIAFPDFAVSAKIGSATYDATWSNSYSVLMITDTGFKVNQYSSNKVRSNEGGMTYRYIAFRG